jgi:glycosyltransferase involved in cell wall biosynthesis
MTVSVIITCYNYGNFLHEAIESVLFQTYRNKEIETIVVNDGSTDNTSKVAEKYQVTLLNQPNTGLPIARNNGIKYSKGRFILPLDADDKLHPQFLEKTVPLLENSPNVGVVYTHRRHFGLLQTTKYAEIFDLETLKKRCILNYCSLYKRQVWLECGGYNPNMKLGYEDWDFWLSIAENNWDFQLVNEVLFYYRKHGTSLSHIAKENHNKLMEIIRNNHLKLFPCNKLRIE